VLASPLAKDEWRVALANDDEAKQLETKAKHRRDGFKKVDGLLYENYRLYVPKSKRENLLQGAHKSDLAVHGGIQATLDRLDSFWWPSLRRDVTNACEACLECQRRKTPRHKPPEEMHLLTPAQLIVGSRSH